MKKQRKSRFWTFCFSFMPGAAEMYMGFMKAGLSLMTGFMALCFMAVVLNIGPILFAAAVAWFYSFFHARNYAGLSQQELEQVEDDYVFHMDEILSDKMKHAIVNQKGIAYILIVIGAYVLFQGMFSALRIILPDNFFYYVNFLEDISIRSILGLVIIYVGLRLVHGKKEELFQGEEKTGNEVSLLTKEEEYHGADENSQNA